MIVVMGNRSSPTDVDAIVRQLQRAGADHSVIELSGRCMIEVFDAGVRIDVERLEHMREEIPGLICSH